ncbi:MAG: SDR family oxidoreductase [Clostridium sp.]|uniref:elongation factor P 5-aminopentanone reductase n=1 Tax=Clostridium sp. TaxID=1506 RepID=UPI0025C43E69|nr:SDR family oxidoreductase [Clostridium sp.]MCH3963066.1 SDR family oxidoreductase [Clostridium sp.]MCI1716471.1 SDR family oxidoreductase [Clostridium sp.]MCI1800811.1 SDR family oxidoreductase [Clostridium sp.]MCI1814534.1 SDR family oxidoreductase [Clostridium sp.]MCI1871444.1 SDR family oxidoreductase [Clostridium sp.]
MENLGGKVAVVTGASRGIGKSIAVNLARCGANVVVNYKSSRSEAEQTLSEIKKYGSTGLVVQSDISMYEDARKLMDRTVEYMGRIDILVNNAGVSDIGVFVDMVEEQWNKIIDVDLKGVLNCTHCALKYMIPKKNGNIVNISSIWGNAGASCEAVYSAAKGAVNSFTKSIAKEMALSNIRINAVAPGVIDTRMNGWLGNQEKQDLIDEIPAGRFGKTDDIGSVVAFLCSESSRYITGQVITVDGGML